MSSIVLASHNAGKIKEFNQLFAAHAVTIVPQTFPSVPEIGLTFVENALIKARHAAQITGLPAIGDDSGLEVDALQGAPGIYSARYAGEHATATERIEKLLQALTGVEKTARTARFQCVLVYLRHAADPTPIIAQGTWEGEILLAPQGEGGFGYDPIFYVTPLGLSAAQLTAVQKNQLSHRGQALAQLMQKLFG
jgi:XTP/dITP diphosphohydrolase